MTAIKHRHDNRDEYGYDNSFIDEEFWSLEDESLNEDAFAIHPGLLLKNVILPDRGFTAARMADTIGVARPGFNNMLNGKRALTPSVAIMIEAVLQYPAKALMIMMTNYELYVARNSKRVLELV